ncbi:MAG: universal stress protein [Vulcanimicrobiaceae bacterium]
MFSHILIAWDASPNARRAFDYALEIAKRFDSRLNVAVVARSAEHADSDTERRRSVEEARRFYQERSSPLLEAARERGVHAELLVLEGEHPAEKLVETAAHVGADVIVIGRRGRSAMSRFLMGSTSDRVVRYASCPVLVVNDR